MKDHLCYDVFRQMGIPAPLTSYAWLRINGRDRGLYLAVEDVSENFLERAYDGRGVIYKPECGDMDLTEEMVEKIRADGLAMPSDPHGADLKYIDDSPESYPDIFENAETKADEGDAVSVIAAMKCMAEGRDLSDCLDTREIIRFFAAHNFLLNYDSYSGGMLHNMVLAEQDGRLSLVPWDYNQAFGAFIPVVGEDALSDATALVNRGIDSPLIGAAEEDRPLWRWIVRDSAYLAQYHDALNELANEYFAPERLEKQLKALHEMLLPYAGQDPTAFFTAEEFTLACETLCSFCERRAESVLRQLAGLLACDSAVQLPEDRVDASDLKIAQMGAAVSR